ncbi:MAG TPA: hypothetical protein VF181_11195 [Balneolaceae bacterium]
MKYLNILFLINGIFFFGCNNTTNEDLGSYNAIVEGQLLNSNNAPIEGAKVLIMSHASSCSEEGISHGVATSDSEGKFKRQLISPTKDKVNCLTLSIKPSSLGLNDTTVTFSTNLELKSAEPFDTRFVKITY